MGATNCCRARSVSSAATRWRAIRAASRARARSCSRVRPGSSSRPSTAGDAAVQNVVGLVNALGATPRFLDATEHDAYVAGISHLPLATLRRARPRDQRGRVVAGHEDAHGGRLPRHDAPRGGRSDHVARHLPDQPRRDRPLARPADRRTGETARPAHRDRRGERDSASRSGSRRRATPAPNGRRRKARAATCCRARATK